MKMRVTSTISVSYRELFLVAVLFVAVTVSIYCIWEMVHGRTRYIEQPLGALAKHRQSGFSNLKNITKNIEIEKKSKLKIVDPPVFRSSGKGQPLLIAQEDNLHDGQVVKHRVHVEEYAVRDVSKLTNYMKSIYRFNSDKETLQLGERLHVSIEARDGRGRLREEGGDFWFATLTTKNNNSGTAGRVVDYANGTYSVYFTIGWTGVLLLDITLVHPSQVVELLTNVIWNEPDRVEWTGHFVGNTTSSYQQCVLRRHYVPLASECLMAYPKEMGQTVLVCGKPKDRQIRCDDLVNLFNNITIIDQRITGIVQNYFHVFVGDHYKRRIVRGPRKIVIEESLQSRNKLTTLRNGLPTCSPDQPLDDLQASGYWDNNIWKSMLCKTKTDWSKPEEIGRCLKGKHVYFLGDSTVRQWLEMLSAWMGAPFHRRAPEEQNNVSRWFGSSNTTLTFRSHPLLLTANQNGTSHRKLAFEVDILDGLSGKDCNYVVGIGSWAHFPQWTRESYSERVGLLRDAVLRIKARCPSVKIVVTGSHPREQPSKESIIYYNDLLIRRLGETLEKAFRDSGAYFMDLWDVNLGYPARMAIHMPDAVIKGELSMFLSYVCGVKTKHPRKNKLEK